MKPSLFDYAVPTSIEEAVNTREKYDDSVILAGGQSLVPTLNFRLSNPDIVIDLSGIPELTGVSISNGWIDVGAMTRQRELELDAESFRENPLIRETLAYVAHPVIRNRGTVGGSIAHADPSAELPCLLTALDGTVIVYGRDGYREIAATDLFEFIMTTSLKPSEIITRVRFPVMSPSSGWSFVEFARRHGDFALAGVATAMALDTQGRINWIRLAACGIAETPVRLHAVEASLIDSFPSAETFADSSRLAADAVMSPDDGTVSKSYRSHLVVGLVERALHNSLDRTLSKEQFV